MFVFAHRRCSIDTNRRHVLHAQLLGHYVLDCRTGFHLSRLKSQSARPRASTFVCCFQNRNKQTASKNALLTRNKGKAQSQDILNQN